MPSKARIGTDLPNHPPEVSVHLGQHRQPTRTPPPQRVAVPISIPDVKVCEVARLGCLGVQVRPNQGRRVFVGDDSDIQLAASVVLPIEVRRAEPVAPASGENRELVLASEETGAESRVVRDVKDPLHIGQCWIPTIVQRCVPTRLRVGDVAMRGCARDRWRRRHGSPCEHRRVVRQGDRVAVVRSSVVRPHPERLQALEGGQLARSNERLQVPRGQCINRHENCVVHRRGIVGVTKPRCLAGITLRDPAIAPEKRRRGRDRSARSHHAVHPSGVASLERLVGPALAIARAAAARRDNCRRDNCRRGASSPSTHLSNQLSSCPSKPCMGDRPPSASRRDLWQRLGAHAPARAPLRCSLRLQHDAVPSRGFLKP